MHPSSMELMRSFVVRYANVLPGCPEVLDVGSYSVNGSYRALFDKRFQYTGLDMAAGPNVDLVLPAYDWSSLRADAFDIVISGQAFEHIEFFWVIMGQMARVLKPTGLLCLIAPTKEIGEHRYPVDCYRFFTDGMVALARYVSLTILHAAHVGTDAIVIARKPYSGAAQYVDLTEYSCIPPDHKVLRGDLK